MGNNAPTIPNVDDSQAAQPDITQADSEKQIRHNTTTSDPESQDDATANIPPAVNKQSAFKSLGWLDRYLAVWILLAIIIGILLGNFAPGAAATLDRGRFVGVSVPIAVGLLVMMYPILCKVRFESLAEVFADRGIWKQIGFSIVMNWIVAPFLMLGLAWATLPDQPDLRTGLILVGLGRCIAMVLIWTDLAGGDGEYCAILVAINSVLQIVLFAPLAVFFIRVISRESGELAVPYDVVATSVAVFLGIPFGAALISRFGLRAIAGPEWYRDVFLRFVAPWSLIGLLYTIIVLFAYQGQQVVHQIVSVVRVAVPLVLYFVIIFFLTLWITHRAGLGYRLGATQSFTAASNNFELAIAVAVAVYGPYRLDAAFAKTSYTLLRTGTSHADPNRRHKALERSKDFSFAVNTLRNLLDNMMEPANACGQQNRFSYLEEPINPYLADYDLSLQSYSESETRHWYYQERRHIIKRADWRSQRERRNTKTPTNEIVWRDYGLLRETLLVPRDTSCQGPNYQKMINDKVIAEKINVVIAYKPTAQEAEHGTLPCIFYIHGGCRYGGTPYSGYLERAKQWAIHLDAIVVSVDYRLSPNESDETPTGEDPTNDCFDALTWVYHHLGTGGDSALKYGDRDKLIVFGTSAGGGLAASAVMKWYHERREGPARALGPLHGLVLEAPQLDDRCNTQSHEQFKNGNMFTSRDALQGWNASLGDRRGTDHVSIFEAPARASDADVQGLPPTYMEVGTVEPFRDEVGNFCNILRKAKVQVEMNVWEGGFHGFFAAEPTALISKLCNLAKLRWLCQRLGVHVEYIENEYHEAREAYDDRRKGREGWGGGTTKQLLG
ncbi:hypothetical protein NUW58_g7730 [Xylaria curta]|uniref:Uncharacterized protein n=1 Tax=Xylaria curta TaxID=42375 RepID=A0ACC1NFT4_9PEZI|nr:hypothetical protein NUW58_g7730 [Xylaria curta]